MPEMAAHCGEIARVSRRADVTCVEGLGRRRLKDTVFLERLRCNGSAHDGCQRNCLIFWKEAWLEPIDGELVAGTDDAQRDQAAERTLRSLPVRNHSRYLCQSTALAKATASFGHWNLTPVVSQVRDGEISPVQLFQILRRLIFNRVRRRLGLKEIGRLEGAKSTSPRETLGLEPGDSVRIKSPDEIARTLDPHGRNRGLVFEAEMSEYSGQIHQVDYRIEKIIHEETGAMINLTGTVALKDLVCQGLCAKGCPRANTWFWRESWLERVSPTDPEHSSFRPRVSRGAAILSPSITRIASLLRSAQ